MTANELTRMGVCDDEGVDKVVIGWSWIREIHLPVLLEISFKR